MTEQNDPRKQKYSFEESFSISGEPLENNLDSLHFLLDQTNDLILLHDLTGQICYSNPICDRLLGYTPEQLVQSGLNQNGVSDIREHVLENFRKSDTSYSGAYPVKHRNGQSIWLETMSRPIFDAGGKVSRIVSVSRDVTDRILAENVLETTRQLLHQRIQDLERRESEIIILTRMVNTLQICAEPGEAYAVIAEFLEQLIPELYGVLMILNSSGDQLETRACWGKEEPPFMTFSPDDCWATRLRVPYLVPDTGEGLVCKHVDAEITPGYLCMPITVQAKLTGLLYFASDDKKTPLKETLRGLAAVAAEQIGLVLSNLHLRRNLREQAIHDSLTGLYNRSYMEETLERELHRAERNQEPLSILMMDLDHFKEFNDRMGHPAGDALLSALGDMLVHSIRAGDIACRYGGEEFILILPRTPLEIAARRAEALRGKVNALHVMYEDNLIGSVKVSVGVSASPVHGKISTKLIKAADNALYHAKIAGRDRVVVAEPITSVGNDEILISEK